MSKSPGESMNLYRNTGIDASAHFSSYERTNDFGDNLSACCWMPVHYDDYYLDKNGCYTINICYADDDAVLVHRSGGKIVATRPFVGEQIIFRAACQHTLVPSDVAEQCVKHQSMQAAKRFFKKIDDTVDIFNEKLPTMLVWEFIPS